MHEARKGKKASAKRRHVRSKPQTVVTESWKEPKKTHFLVRMLGHSTFRLL
jgi:hypothetical protein